ncbi:hypothetical protein ACPWUE_18515 [Bacillus velezensis]|uniref:hypothetical protein n=1 Tax=Bacillus velezensis TaxID=492670 RepID=UPI003CF6FF24
MNFKKKKEEKRITIPTHLLAGDAEQSGNSFAWSGWVLVVPSQEDNQNPNLNFSDLAAQK